MKKIFYLATLLFLFISCQEVIEVDVPNGISRLAVDASYEVYLGENYNEVEIIGGVKLTVSTHFFDENSFAVSNATVFITDLENSQVYPLYEFTEPGMYRSYDEEFVPQFDREYELTIVFNNEIYKSRTTLISTVPIDKVEQGDRVLFGGNEKEVIVTYTDNADTDDFYLIDFDFNLYLPTDDRFYQGKTFPLSYFYEDSGMIEKEVTIKILGIDQSYYNYLNILIAQSSQEGDPFQTPPAALRGNIINITNPDNIALGYFNLSEANRRQLILK